MRVSLDLEVMLSTIGAMTLQSLLEMKNTNLYHFFTRFLFVMPFKVFSTIEKPDPGNSWIKNNREGQLTEVFQVLNNKLKRILEYHTDLIEAFVKIVCDLNSKNLEKLDTARCNNLLLWQILIFVLYLHLELDLSNIRNEQPCREDGYGLRHNLM